MAYTDAQFGRDLLTKLASGYDSIRIAKLALMEVGPEFTIPECELRDMAHCFMDHADRL